ncbi:MAG TPA: hypothetical protein VEM77_03220 [Thermoplasmata archaeon]|nr:hypothetical protein [Thermoplasmata archaeon]
MTLREKISDLLKKAGIDIAGRLKDFIPSISVSASRRGGLNVRQRGKINIFLVPPDILDRALLRGVRPAELVSRSDEGRELRGMVRTDLQPYDSITLTALDDEAHLVSVLAMVVPPEDLEALSIAMNIRRVEFLGKVDAALNLRDALRRRCGERGNRIFLFYSTGMLKEFMEPFLAMVEFTPTISEKDRALKVWNLCLEHMEHAVYVNKLMTSERVVAEIRYRLDIDHADIVLVFGLGKHVCETIEDAFEKIEQTEGDRQTAGPRIKTKIDSYDFGKLDGVVGRVTRTESA